MAFDVDTRSRTPSAGQVRAPAARATVDLATILGLLGASALILAAVILGGSPAAFVDIPSILIVVGGTAGVTTASFSLGDMVATLRNVAQTVLHSARQPQAAAIHVLQLAEVSRHHGILVLEPYLSSLRNQRVLFQGVSMVVDGTTGDDIDRILQSELQGMAQSQTRSAAVLRKAAEVSPAMGLIGTLVGLVQMLGNIQDPSSIGPSMAVALLTTFYGALLANILFTPLAAKLERNSIDEMLINQMYVMASASMARQENPRRLEMLLNTVLPPGQRIDYFG